MKAQPGIEHRSLTPELQTNASLCGVCMMTGGSYSLLQELLLLAVESWKLNVKEILKVAVPVCNKLLQYWPLAELERASWCTIILTQQH